MASRWVGTAARIAVDEQQASPAAAVELLERLMRIAVPMLERLMTGSTDPLTQSVAAGMLAAVPRDRALDTLRELLDDPDADVFAAAALARDGGEHAVERLAEVLADDGDTPLRRLAAARALMNVSDPQIYAVLVAALDADPCSARGSLRVASRTFSSSSTWRQRTTTPSSALPPPTRDGGRSNRLAEDATAADSRDPRAMLSQLISSDPDARAAAAEALLRGGREPELNDVLWLIDEHFADGTDLTEVVGVLHWLKDPDAVLTLIWLLAARRLADAELCRVGARRDRRPGHAAGALPCRRAGPRRGGPASRGRGRGGPRRRASVGDAAARGRTDPGLKDKDERVARRAGKALAELDGLAAIPGLLDLLRSDAARCVAVPRGRWVSCAPEATDALIEIGAVRQLDQSRTGSRVGAREDQGIRERRRARRAAAEQPERRGTARGRVGARPAQGPLGDGRAGVGSQAHLGCRPRLRRRPSARSATPAPSLHSPALFAVTATRTSAGMRHGHWAPRGSGTPDLRCAWRCWETFHPARSEGGRPRARRAALGRGARCAGAKRER